MRRPVLLVLLCAVVTLCAWPALTGDALFDDLALVPLRHAPPRADVFTEPPRWQPVVALSFRAVAALAPRDFAVAVSLHHVASLALLFAAVALLLEVARARHPGDRVHPWHALALGAFALHPSLVEAFGHLAARGEALALAALAGLALALDRGRPGVAVACAALGVASSPVAGPAAAALALADAADRGTPRARRAGAALALGSLLGALLAALPGLAARPGLADLARWGARVPRAVAIAARALLVPTETAMRLPHWELSLPLTAPERLAAALPALAGVFLWRRGARGAAVLALGAAASVLPLVVRADRLLYGFDRYLAGAAVLLTVAVLRAPPPRWTTVLSRGTARLVGACGVGALALLVFLGRQTATGFTSESHQLDAMTQMRPRDPSGHLRNAWFSVKTGDREQAERSLNNTRRRPLTPLMRRVLRAIAVAVR